MMRPNLPNSIAFAALLAFTSLVAGSVLAPLNVVAQAPANPAAANGNAGVAPFPALAPAEQQKLDQNLLAWQQQSQGTKTLQCKFQRWHYDLMKAPAGVHAQKSDGEIRYASPDRGLFKVTKQSFFKAWTPTKSHNTKSEQASLANTGSATAPSFWSSTTPKRNARFNSFLPRCRANVF